jgi:hypothetical protein
MPGTPSKKSVDVGTVAYPPTRCAGCCRRLSRKDRAAEGRLPISTPERLVKIHGSVCTCCLDDADLSYPSSVQRLVLAIFFHVGRWYAASLPLQNSPATGLFSSTRGFAQIDED